MDRPFGLLAELTHRCPLHCAYCSNPLAGVTTAGELSTPVWTSVFDQARALGVMQLHLSGGEPLMRRDLRELVAHGRQLGLYVNLVTSGVGLDNVRATELAAAGLDHVQLSVQDSNVAAADAMARSRVTAVKLRAAQAIVGNGMALTVNVVLHRHNIDRIPQLVELAVGFGADRLELANTQYYGSALRNRAALLPGRNQLAAAEAAVAKARAGYGDSIQIVYVLADYYETYPKPCMHGWGRRHIVIAPDGRVLPCVAAAEIAGLATERVGGRSLAEIWQHSDAFTRFRGTAWLPEPCHSCARRDVDFGGCRCQAFLMTGDAGRTDPVCVLSPDHHLVETAVQSRNSTAALWPRLNPGTRRPARRISEPIGSHPARKAAP